MREEDQRAGQKRASVQNGRLYGKEKLIERGEVRRPEKYQALVLSEPGGQDVIGMLIGATDSPLSLLTDQEMVPLVEGNGHQNFWSTVSFVSDN